MQTSLYFPCKQFCSTDESPSLTSTITSFFLYPHTHLHLYRVFKGFLLIKKKKLETMQSYEVFHDPPQICFLRLVSYMSLVLHILRVPLSLPSFSLLVKLYWYLRWVVKSFSLKMFAAVKTTSNYAVIMLIELHCCPSKLLSLFYFLWILFYQCLPFVA